jgi:hypothetical protein
MTGMCILQSESTVTLDTEDKVSIGPHLIDIVITRSMDEHNRNYASADTHEKLIHAHINSSTFA